MKVLVIPVLSIQLKKSAFLLQCPFNQFYCILPVSNTSSTKGACRTFNFLHRIPICGVVKMEIKIMTTKRHHDYTIFHYLFIYLFQDCAMRTVAVLVSALLLFQCIGFSLSEGNFFNLMFA